MRQLRIAFITNNYHPYSGGVVRSIDAITNQLQKIGHDVLIIAPQFLTHHNDASHVKRIPSTFRFLYKKKRMAVPWRSKYYLKKFLNNFKPDIVHVHHPFLLGSVASRVARGIGIPVFFTYHTIYQDYVHYVPLPKKMMQRVVTNNVINFCKTIDEIIVPSTGIKSYLKNHVINNTTVLPSPLRSIFCKQPFVQKKIEIPFKLLCVTRFTKEKNLPFLFEVLKKLPNEYQLQLVGYGDQENYLRTLAQPFGERVQFIIKPSQTRLIKLYRNAHLFLFSSTSDTQALVLAESMACSTPVIAIDGIGQRDIIKHGKNGFIVNNADEMQHYIVALMHDQKNYEELQQSAYTTAMNYNPKVIVDNLIARYTSHVFTVVHQENRTGKRNAER